MFQKLLDLFAAIFGIEREAEKPIEVPTDPIPEPPVIKPQGEDKDPDIINRAQDASEVHDEDSVRVIDEEKNQVISGEEDKNILTDDAQTPIVDSIDDGAQIIVPIEELEPRYLWILDNGHGKLTRGKRSPVFGNNQQFFEYEFNRDIVERIMKRLDELGIRYYDLVPDYARVGNILEERVRRANRKSSELPKIFLSVHSNAGPTRSPNDWVIDQISGTETWYYHSSTKGRKLARIFQKKLIEATGWKNRHIKSRSKNQFYVLKKTTMPAILTENGFYNNKNQVLELQKEEVRQLIAEAHVQAILQVERFGG